MRKLNHTEVPVHDAAAFFSEEEWKLLRKWQKDLYSNVMKEIRQALLSLGPLIATTVMSLKERENEVLYPRDYAESESWRCGRHSPGRGPGISSVSLRNNGERSQCLKRPYDNGKREIIDHVDTGHQFVNSKTVEGKSLGNVYTPDGFPAIRPDLTQTNQEEQQLHFHDWARSENNTQPHEGCLFLDGPMCSRKDEEYQAALMGLPEKGVEHSAGCSSAEHEVVSFTVKDEQEAWSLDSSDANRQSFHNFTGIQGQAKGTKLSLVSEPRYITQAKRAQDGISKHRKVDNFFQNREKISTQNISSTKTNMDMTSPSEKAPSAMNRLQCKSFLEFGAENTSDCEMVFSSPAQINLLHRVPTVQTSEPDDKSESNLRDAHFLSGLRKANPMERLHTCSECKRCFSHKAVLVRHLRTHSRVRPYACTECKKSFFKKGDFTRHRRTHTGEKPFLCIDCHKRFNRKGNLEQHRILIHSGVRPFKCSECEKTFSRQCDLAKHITKHRQINNVPFLSSVQ